MYDVIIIGGSYAGLSAALQTGRARRSTLIIDAGERRNRFASHAHGFLGHDGESPAAIAAKGKAEALAYPTVKWQQGRVTSIKKGREGFTVLTDAGEHVCKRIILATGAVDQLPEIEGLRERWGSTVFHCPYCHGYELNQGRLAVLASNELAVHFAMLVAEWGAAGETTLFMNGAPPPEAEAQAELARRGVRIEMQTVAACEGDAPTISVRLADGQSHTFDGLFVAPRTSVTQPFVQQLGCELESGPTGSFLKTDAFQETTVPGVFACGDVARAMTFVTFAVAEGAMAGVAVHKSLIFPKA